MDEEKADMKEGDAVEAPKMEEHAEAKHESKGGYGYGKKNMGKMIGIYIIVAIVLYGAIYYWYKANHQATTGSGTTNSLGY